MNKYVSDRLVCENVEGTGTNFLKISFIFSLVITSVNLLTYSRYLNIIVNLNEARTGYRNDWLIKV